VEEDFSFSNSGFSGFTLIFPGLSIHHVECFWKGSLRLFHERQPKDYGTSIRTHNNFQDVEALVVFFRVSSIAWAFKMLLKLLIVCRRSISWFSCDLLAPRWIRSYIFVFSMLLIVHGSPIRYSSSWGLQVSGGFPILPSKAPPNKSWFSQENAVQEICCCSTWWKNCSTWPSMKPLL